MTGILLRTSWIIQNEKKNIENQSTFAKLINECIVAQFVLRHGVECAPLPHRATHIWIYIYTS